MEIRFVYGSEDYLVFGLDEDYLLQNPRLYLTHWKTSGTISKRRSFDLPGPSFSSRPDSRARKFVGRHGGTQRKPQA